MKTYSISIPKPCQENWADMSPMQQGRFCASCQKKVQDFTLVSDAEIVRKMAAGGEVCGRLSPAQLNREMRLPEKKSGLWLASVSGLIGILPVAGFEAKAQEPTAVSPGTSVKMGKALIVERKQTIPVSGIVTDAGVPLPAVTITIGNEVVGTTNIDGVFLIEASVNDVLAFSYVGYIEQTFIVKNEPANDVTIKMDGAGALMGEVIYVRRTFAGRTIQKIRNLFR